ncbi:MAG: hypothetical protein ACRDT6_06065 [Micromonosporaceae bacterium]
MTHETATLHEYRIRYATADGEPREVRAAVDTHRAAITYELPDGARATVDVVAARALYMIFWEAVFNSLEPTGPYLRLERNTGAGWPDPGSENRPDPGGRHWPDPGSENWPDPGSGSR